MPKITNTPKSQTQRTADSDAKRGFKTKGLKLHIDDIALIESLSERLNIPQNQLIMDAIRAYEKQLG
ncbi:hypothetical protein [Moraxella bovis]|uniref:Ribbon-helix-helix protein, CopG family n=1 Tax=Moraxella bovis TaxID=476 RepID=A0A2Z4R6R4_MORBO|nr:hypothetical protein [Moraxella bovis]AWY20100.1 hypothetical protein DQF64_06030 [Moraxella bovis]UYZ79318.1 hypothetical protein LP115_05660 [Moraxella bovis]UYZ87798.1 hypothetical protein LP094_05665 [Moraxella bovis]UYZ90508.1 hypothetical protein LP114_05405 [Moraxella bovis]UYZ93204.1 hypothetical protein LP103_05535 [Moraxella bovis]